MKYHVFEIGKQSIIYGEENGNATVTVVPSDMSNKLNEEKMNGIDPFGNKRIESAVQVAVDDNRYPRDISAGRTHRNMGLSFDFGVPTFTYNKEKGILVAEFKTEKGLIVRQHYESTYNDEILVSYTETENRTGENVTLDNMPSFIISRISPFVKFNDEIDIIIHTMRNYWSAEANLQSQPLSYYMFEDSWSGLGIRSERIGQLGSMPANKYIPWIGVEDKTNDCVWSVMLEAPSSWQIEMANVFNGLSIDGGLADYTFGHWKKTLKNGEVFSSRKAYITVCHGGINHAINNFVSLNEKLSNFIPSEEDLPIIYNEYCSTWGAPDIKFVEKLLPVCKDLGIDYFVVDAGWYRDDSKDWNSLGDWIPNKKYFPNGLKGYVDLCKKYNMRAGVWFEFESVSIDSDIAKKHPEWLLTFNNKVIVHGKRAMLDMRKSEVKDYLREKVIKQLKDSGIGYMKVDYNESFGLGLDGAESPGEGVRQQVEASINFFDEILESVPDLLLEICSSGGMRHENKWLSLGNMVSFSDAHEGPEGAIIASRLHRFIPPRKMQVWATIREDYDENWTYFTVAKAMLGRVCLSGNLADRKENILNIIREGINFYNSIKHIVKCGSTLEIKENNIKGLRNIHGSTWLKRISEDNNELLVYDYIIGKHSFVEKINIPSGFEIVNAYGNAKIQLDGNNLIIKSPNVEVVGCVVHMRKK